MPDEFMTNPVGPIEVDHRRVVIQLGLWTIGPARFKIYGLVAANMDVTDQMQALSKTFLHEEVLQKIKDMGESNDLGFVIIHPGELGLSISAHWWVQGSVLCQHNYRRQYADDEPLDTITRPVVACVWELALINAEQEAWRATMMTVNPDCSAYLARRSTAPTV